MIGMVALAVAPSVQPPSLLNKASGRLCFTSHTGLAHKAQECSYLEGGCHRSRPVHGQEVKRGTEQCM